MDENFQYNIYLIGQLNNIPINREDHLVPYALFNTHKECENEAEALEWIKNDGNENYIYTILPIRRGGN